MTTFFLGIGAIFLASFVVVALGVVVFIYPALERAEQRAEDEFRSWIDCLHAASLAPNPAEHQGERG